jgi:capping protein alpha
MGVLPVLQQYNLEQLTVAEVPGAGHSVGRYIVTFFTRFSHGVRTQSIVSTRARIPGEQDRFLDPRSKTSFVFDHLSLVCLVSLNYLFHLHCSVGSLRPTSPRTK